MKKLKNIKEISLIFIVIFLISCNYSRTKKEKITSRVSALPYFNEASFTPKWLDSSSEELDNFHKIPDFMLTNQNGEKISKKTFENKIYVANFFFTTCPGICPKMTSNMDLVQQAFIKDNDVLMLSHTVTPSIDSVAQLKKYALNKGVLKNWHLVTGLKKEIYDLGRNSYFVEENLGEPKGLDDFLHTENFILVDKNKHIRGIYNGLYKNSVIQLIADIKTLKKE